MDGSDFVGASGLGKAMAASPDTTLCVAQRALSYATGRGNDDVSSLVEALEQQFAGDNYNIRALFRRVATMPEAYRVVERPLEGQPTNLTMLYK
jgi:uncharacterized protein (DUF1800 family)